MNTLPQTIHTASSLFLSKHIFNYIIFLTLISAVYYYSFILNQNSFQSIESSLRLLSEEKDDITTIPIKEHDDEKTISNQTKWRIVHNLIRETYIGTWAYQSHKSYTNFTATKGKMQIIFRLLRSSSRHLHDFYYTYDMILFDGEYNDHTLIMSSSIPLSFHNDIPRMTYDNKTQLITIVNNISSSFNEYKILAKKAEHILDSNMNLSYSSNKTGYALNKDLNGIISFNDISIAFNLQKHRPTFYQSISSFTCWLSVIGLIQAFYSKYQMQLFIQSPEEALKYSPYTFVVNFLYNGSIAFECLLASLLDETMFYSFIIPSIIYFVNFCFLELKVIVMSWNIHENDNRREMTVRIAAIKNQLVHFFILFYLLLICLFIYSFDLFFWRSIAYFVVIMTFVPQILYGMKKKQSGSIIYLLIISLNKLYVPIYFRVKDNFLHFKADNIFVIAISSILLTEIAIILIEKYLCGSDCFRDNHLNLIISNGQKQNNKKKLNKYHMTSEQLMKRGIQVDSINCTICLSSLNPLTQGKENTILGDIEIAQDNPSIKGKEKNKDLVELNNENIRPSIANKCMKKLCKCCSKFTKKKEVPLMLMVTPCKHVFHIECLEPWLKRQSTCPQCRTDIPQVN